MTDEVATPSSFTVEHFRRWALELELDNGKPWIVEPYFEQCVEDYFAGLRENWWLVPEGNAKTTSVAGLAVYLLEHRGCAEIPWAASARDQAEIGYRQAAGFIRRSERLSQLMRCYDGYRRIVNLETGGRIQVFAADDRTGDGVIPTDAFLDELHRHPDLRLYRTWQGKLDKRGGQLATISTAGEPGSDFEETRTFIRQSVPIVESMPGFVRCRSDAIAFHEYAVPEGGDVEDMETVKLANPFGAITVESLARKRATPTMTLPHWTRFTCNIATRSEMAAIMESEWADAATTDEIPEGAEVWLGIDVAWKWDTTAIVPLYWRDAEYRLLGPATILVPPRDGTSLDPALVEAAVLEFREAYRVDTVVMDTSKAEQLAAWIESELGCNVIDRQQTNALACVDFARFMEALREGWLHHSGDQGMREHALNAVARVLPGGDARFDRPAANRRSPEQNRRVIDALTAASMVHSVRVGVGDYAEVEIF
jgi:phage terminase large subunit-like protein